jgi:PBP1b-binding outer membrane lipoprotein LpoB
MKKIIFIVLPAFFLAACAQEPPTPATGGTPPKKAHTAATPKPDNPENFRAVEKPSTYGQ